MIRDIEEQPMSRTVLLIAVMTVGSLLLVESASAGYIRCGGHIIQDGLDNGHTKYEVLKKCGEPTERHGHTWIYHKRGSLKKTVRFKADGSLQSIRQ